MKVEIIILIFVIALFAAIFAVELALFKEADISIKEVFQDLKEWLVSKLKGWRSTGKKRNDE